MQDIPIRTTLVISESRKIHSNIHSPKNIIASKKSFEGLTKKHDIKFVGNTSLLTEERREEIIRNLESKRLD